MPMSQADFKAWRATIPFTDKEIADCIRAQRDRYLRDGAEHMAAHMDRWANAVEKGFVTGKAAAFAATFLVNKCALCGGKALYRWGTEGRCSKHRMDKPAWYREKEARLRARQADFEFESGQRWRQESHRRNLHTVKRRMRR